MWASLIAVFGTLAGALVSGLLQHRTARTDRLDARAEQLRHEQIETVTALAHALADHRMAMWKREEARLAGRPADRVTELRDASHETRSAVTDPETRLRLLIADDAVRGAADAATASAYALRNARDLDELRSRRRVALEAHTRLIDTAGTRLASA